MNRAGIALTLVAYLHTLGCRGGAGGPVAAILVVGFISVLFTYFAVGVWVSGLPSYAGVPESLTPSGAVAILILWRPVLKPNTRE